MPSSKLVRITFRLTAIAVSTALKAIEDIPMQNDMAAAIYKITPEEFNELEVYFLETLDYDVQVCREQFTQYGQMF